MKPEPNQHTAQRPRLSRSVRAHVPRQPGSWQICNVMPRTILSILCILFSGVLCGAEPSKTEAPAEKKISLDYKDVEIRTVLRDVADRCELNLVIPEALQGTTSVKLNDVTWKQAFYVILQPIGYTQVEDGSIVKVVALEDLSPTKSATLMTRRGQTPGWFDGPWYVVGGIVVFCLVLAVCHVVLFVGVLRDVLPNGPSYAPKFVWAFFVLFGGVVPLVGYWLIHHSTLKKNENRA